MAGSNGCAGARVAIWAYRPPKAGTHEALVIDNGGYRVRSLAAGEMVRIDAGRFRILLRGGVGKYL